VTVSPIFGQILTSDAVEQAVVDTLLLWLPTYLAEMERQTGRDPQSVPMPKSVVRQDDINDMDYTEENIPMLVVSVPGTTEPPRKDGGGRYSTTWICGVGFVVAARDQYTTRRLSRLYIAAARAILVQKQSLGNFAEAVYWVGEEFNDIPKQKKASLAAGQSMFLVVVPDFMQDHGGPMEPVPTPDLPDPVGDWPTVIEADVEVTQF
jgi:hypothetical protein